MRKWRTSEDFAVRFIYSVCFYLAIPFILIRLLWRSRRAPDYRKRWAERFGFFQPPAKTGSIWVHTVSVGEFIAAQPLIKRLLNEHPELPITVTTTTPTGSARVLAAFADQVFHVYAPYDYPAAIRRFISKVQPRLAIMMETELWPNIFAVCQQQTIPIFVANARLSARSAKGYQRIKPITRGMLDCITHMAAQDQATADRYIALGLDRSRISMTGSVKFDFKVAADVPEAGQVLRRQWDTSGAISRPVWIAASTHEGEDEKVLTAFAKVREWLPDTLLILVPRHPERFNKVAELCQRRGFKITRRSNGAQADTQTQVFLGDTMGEMMLFYAASDVAFVGGSLVSTGGHNLLEPAALEIPSLCGPHVFNFAEITQMLIEVGATQQIADEQHLATAVVALLQDAAARQKAGRAGLQVVENNRGALQKHLDLIDRSLRN